MFFHKSKSLPFLAMVLSCGLAACGGGNGGGSSTPVVVPTVSPASAPTATPTTEPKTSVVTTLPYTPSATTVVVGEQVTVVASGTVNFETPSEWCELGPGACHTDPNGLPWSYCEHDPSPAFTAPGLNCWSMIGRIGVNGKPFQLGSSMTFTAARTGLLYVGVNDNDYLDNSGTWTAAFTPIGLVTP